jgi:hypothetical protein
MAYKELSGILHRWAEVESCADSVIAGDCEVEQREWRRSMATETDEALDRVQELSQGPRVPGVGEGCQGQIDGAGIG